VDRRFLLAENRRDTTCKGLVVYVEVTVNGKKMEAKAASSLSAFLRDNNFSLGKIVVEHNSKIIAAEKWQSIILQPQDRLEIVTFVGGG
jgi:sulfur carrier protein